MRNLILLCFSLMIASLSCSRNPSEPVQTLPDLTILGITYSYEPGRLAGIIDDTIRIKNIGTCDFYGLLYIAQASERYFRLTGYFGNYTLAYYDWSSDSVKPARISVGETIVCICGTVVPNDTNIVRFHIETDGKGEPPTSIPLPTYPESNYNNNDYLLVIR